MIRGESVLLQDVDYYEADSEPEQANEAVTHRSADRRVPTSKELLAMQ